MIGDLDEEFRLRAAPPRRGAAAWYWRQAFASMPGALRLRWQRAAPLTDLRGDVRRALRMLARHPGFAAAAIATMALGSGITTGVVSIVEAVLVRPLPYPNGGRVMAIQEHDGTRQGRSMSWRDFAELSGALTSFAALAGYTGGSRTLTTASSAERVLAIGVTSRFFEVLGVRPVLGRDFNGADTIRGAAPVVILTNDAWRRRFGSDPAALGRTVMLSGVAHTIVGVLPPDFTFPPRGDPELWLPFTPSAEQVARPYWHFLDVIGSRRSGVAAAAANEELRTRAERWHASGDQWHATTGLGSIGLRDEMVAGVRPALLVLLGAALIVLLAAAVNVSGLVLARAATRAREVGVRAALGASRWRLIRSLLVEAFSIALFGASAGLMLAAWAVATVGATIPLRFRAALPYADQLGVSPLAAAVSVGVTILAVLLAGIAPAFGMRTSNPIAPGSRSTGGRSEARLRTVLVAAQVALAVVLLSGAALIARSVLKLGRVSPGFAVDGLVVGRINFPGGRYDDRVAMVAGAERILEAIRALPGVHGAEVINQLPLTGRGNTGDFSIVGRAETPSTDPLIRDVTPGYFRVMGIPLLEGRGIEPGDKAGATRVVVINKTLAHLAFGDTPPIGQRIRFEFFSGRPEWTIVGIVGDEQFDGLDRPMSGVVYFPFAQDPEGSFGIVVRAASPSAIVPSLRSAVASVDRELPLFGVQTMTRIAADSNAVFLRRLVTRLLAWFAGAALLLAGIGVYGVLAEAIASRTKEIGLRLALGATRRNIAALTVATGLAPGAIGVVTGVALSILAAPAMRSLLFGVGAIDVPSLAAVCAIVALVALAACAIPTRRAIGVPVASALRQD
jgi:putative ABC transport system permease protein